MSPVSSWPRRRLPKPIETFDYPAGHVEAPLDPKALLLPLTSRLSGHPGKPTPEQFREWLKKPETANSSAVKTLFEGMPGVYLVRIRAGCGGSIYELARLFHHCGIDHWEPVMWIDQFSMDPTRPQGLPPYIE